MSSWDRALHWLTNTSDHDNPEYSHTGNNYNVHYSKISLYPERNLGVFYAFSGGNSKNNRELLAVLDVMILDAVLNGHLNPENLKKVDEKMKSWSDTASEFLSCDYDLSVFFSILVSFFYFYWANFPFKQFELWACFDVTLDSVQYRSDCE